MVLALHAALVSSPLFISTAHAQEEDEDFGEGEPEGKKPKKSSKTAKAAADDASTVREINRGLYAKAGAGGALYFLNFTEPGIGNFVSGGTAINIAVGQDFVDTEKQSMAWEIGLVQGVHNGMSAEEQASWGCAPLGTGPAPCTEGDLRTYSLTANYEISFYPTRRLGVGLRVGGGVLYSPLLIEPTAYAETTLDDFGGDPGMHNAPKPLVFGGPTVEYYTKLSHFSIEADIDVVYGIGWDLGANLTGALKYTF